jgi:RNA 2',3'-cyclic 3'-phosphodiesterase
VRLFVALDLPEKVSERLGELIDRLRKQCPHARWVRPEGVHITLKFIGHVDGAKADSIRLALERIRSGRPIEMQFRGVGFFPNERRPRVIWCGVEASPNLAGLVAQIEDSLEPLGVERETRAYTPHLTLARIDAEKVRPGEIEKLVEAVKELETSAFGSSCETAFYLYESVTRPSGAEYKKLQSFAFAKGPA